MAPRRKQRPASVPPPGREFKLRIPEDIAQRIEAKAKAELRPMNRIVINELADYPDLEKYRDFGMQLQEMKDVLARYGGRIVAADLSDDLLHAMSEVLKADERDNVGELRRAVSNMRVAHTKLEKHEQTAKR
jgi:hypothetical protein